MSSPLDAPRRSRVRSIVIAVAVAMIVSGFVMAALELDRIWDSRVEDSGLLPELWTVPGLVAVGLLALGGLVLVQALKQVRPPRRRSPTGRVKDLEAYLREHGALDRDESSGLSVKD